MIDHEKSNDIAETKKDELGQNKSNRTLTFNEMCSNALVFFLGGFENGSNALSWVAYNLARYEDHQERLCNEIDQVLSEHVKNYLDIFNTLFFIFLLHSKIFILQKER